VGSGSRENPAEGPLCVTLKLYSAVSRGGGEATRKEGSRARALLIGKHRAERVLGGGKIKFRFPNVLSRRLPGATTRKGRIWRRDTETPRGRRKTGERKSGQEKRILGEGGFNTDI